MERQKSRPGAADIYVPPEEHWPVNLVSVNYRKQTERNVTAKHVGSVTLSRSFVFVNCASISAFISDPVFNVLFYIPERATPLLTIA